MTACVTGFDILSAIGFDMLLAAMVGATLGFAIGMMVKLKAEK